MRSMFARDLGAVRGGLGLFEAIGFLPPVRTHRPIAQSEARYSDALCSTMEQRPSLSAVMMCPTLPPL